MDERHKKHHHKDALRHNPHNICFAPEKTQVEFSVLWLLISPCCRGDRGKRQGAQKHETLKTRKNPKRSRDAKFGRQPLNYWAIYKSPRCSSCQSYSRNKSQAPFKVLR